MEAKEVQDAAIAWQNENQDNRATLVIFIDSSNDGNGDTQHSARITCHGQEEPLKNTLKAVLKAGGRTKMGKKLQGLLLRTFLETFVDMINDQNEMEDENIQVEQA